MVHSLQEKAGAIGAPVCFVVDGEPLPAKAHTHKSRAIKSRGYLKKARKLASLFLGKPHAERECSEVAERFRKKFRTCASGWVRWFQDLKKLVVDEFRSHGASREFDPENPAMLSIVTAAFEADPKAVEIAHCMGPSLLFSNDGDLLVYSYADHAVVLMINYLLFSLPKHVSYFSFHSGCCELIGTMQGSRSRPSPRFSRPLDSCQRAQRTFTRTIL